MKSKKQVSRKIILKNRIKFLKELLGNFRNNYRKITQKLSDNSSKNTQLLFDASALYISNFELIQNYRKDIKEIKSILLESKNELKLILKNKLKK